MTRKDIFILLSPTVVLLVFGIFAFSSAQMIRRHHNPDRQRQSQQKFDTFVTNVENGTWQLTEDRMLEGMRLSRRVAESEYRISESTGDLIQDFFWCAVLGIAWHVGAVFIVRKRLNRRDG